MTKFIETYKNGEVGYDILLEEKIEDKRGKKESNHICFNCANGSAIKCEKIKHNINLKTVHNYDEFIKNYEIYYNVDEEDNITIDRFIVKECNNYVPAEKNKKLSTILKEREQEKEAKEAKKLKAQQKLLVGIAENRERQKRIQELQDEKNKIMENLTFNNEIEIPVIIKRRIYFNR